MALEDATENPRPGGGFFELSGRLDDLPGFGFDSEGRLVDSPMHPVPLDPSRATTLEDVLDRLSDEEKKYDSCEVTVNQCYVFLKTIQGTASRSGQTWGYCLILRRRRLSSWCGDIRRDAGTAERRSGGAE